MNISIDPTLQRSILDYYEQAGMDYRYWSRSFNMHFGLGSFLRPFDRESMLNRMSDEVLDRLEIPEGSSQLTDMGCGVGATLRRAAKRYPGLSSTGITIVPWQKQKCEEINKIEKLEERICIKLEDFHCTSVPDSSSDGAYCIESACYSPDYLNEAFFAELFRVLKPGRRLVIADGFLKNDDSSLCTFIRDQYTGICRNWALPGILHLARTKSRLLRAGFSKVEAEEVSWRVAPSVLHVPFVIAGFLLSNLVRRQKLSRQSIRNLKGSFQTLLLGLDRRNFGYYLITATK